MVVPLIVLAMGERVTMWIATYLKTFQRGYHIIHVMFKSLPCLLYTYTKYRTNEDNVNK